jgi:hypothetical protein
MLSQSQSSLVPVDQQRSEDEDLGEAELNGSSRTKRAREK